MTKISSLTSLAGGGVDQANDLLTIVDMSEAGAARNKKITVADLLGLITDIAGLLEIKGSTDASANPNYPAADQGDTYVVSVAGKIGGASGTDVEVGDVYFATADNAGGTQAAVGTSWAVIQGNILSGAVGIGVEDEGVAEGTGITVLNFTGSGVSAADVGGGQVDVTIPGGISSFALGDATDVDTAGAATGDRLEYDGAGWVPVGFSGALVKKAADQTTANYSGFPAVAWDSEEYDTDAYHDNATNNSRLSVPAAGYYVVGGEVAVGGGTLPASEYVRVLINRYNSGSVVQSGIGLPRHIVEVSATPTIHALGMSVPILCSAGDYFELYFDTEADTSITVQANESWFGIWRVG
jgi:hypothetical protein